jgi:hypothetical protein
MRKVIGAIALAGALALPGQALARVEIGVLDCVVEGGVGFIVGSSKDVACTFTPAGGPPEPYVGTVDKIGVDIGFTNESVIRWAVIAPTADAYAPGALAGSYGGVSAEATAGAGLGANVLVGGTGDSFMLQPVSLQAQAGLNIAAGLTAFHLVAPAD